MVVGAERIGDGFDSLPRESSSSTSSSSTCADWPSSSLLSSFDGEDSLDIGESWPLCDRNAPRIPPQLFVKLLFSFTCGFAKIALANGSLSSDEAAVAGGELPLVELILASEVNLFEKLEKRINRKIVPRASHFF